MSPAKKNAAGPRVADNLQFVVTCVAIIVGLRQTAMTTVLARVATLISTLPYTTEIEL